MIALLAVIASLVAFVCIAVRIPENYAASNEAWLYAEIAMLCALSAVMGGLALGYVVFKTMIRILAKAAARYNIISYLERAASEKDNEH